MTDFYKILQVDPAADEEVIRAAYQRIIAKVHPDKNDAPDAEQRTKEVNEAYQVLSDPSRRAKYDWTRPKADATPGSKDTRDAQAEVRRAEESRSQERRKREDSEKELRQVQEDLAQARQRARQEALAAQTRLDAAQFRLEDEHQRRREAEAKAAALEKQLALRRGLGLHELWLKAMSRTGRLAWFGAGVLLSGSAFLLADRVSIPVSTQALEPETVFVKGGCYPMGSPDNEPERSRFEGPRHQVCFKGFHLGKFEVSFDEYDRYAQATGHRLPADNGFGRGRRPVINVSWNDVHAYAEWLSQQTGKRYRLPTEAEWEYAARAGTDTAFVTGECVNTNQANYDGRADYFHCGAKTGLYLGKTEVVGRYPANPWGLHDLLGNVGEWVADCWHDDYAGASSHGVAWGKSAENDCELRVVRGGSWGDGPDWLRSAHRSYWRSTSNYADVGFRLALE
jgi:formylglycine-generating enzyme required for sulfatase activity